MKAMGRSMGGIDSSRIKAMNSFLLLMEEISNIGINYQPQLVIAGFLNHQQ